MGFLCHLRRAQEAWLAWLQLACAQRSQTNRKHLYFVNLIPVTHSERSLPFSRKRTKKKYFLNLFFLWDVIFVSLGKCFAFWVCIFIFFWILTEHSFKGHRYLLLDFNSMHQTLIEKCCYIFYDVNPHRIKASNRREPPSLGPGFWNLWVCLGGH